MNPALSSAAITTQRKSGVGWRYGIFGVIALFVTLLVIRWQTLPVFLDIYYHASCMIGFRDAGGIVLHDFWEYAPAGRPHMYPPLFPVIMLGLSKLGLPVLFIMRLVSAAIYPLLLLTIAWVVTKLYNARCAFFTVLAASLPYTFFLNVIAAVPSSLALIILILLFYAIETDKTLCGALLLGLSFYAHGGLPWLTIFTLALYGIFRRGKFKTIFAVILGGIVLGGPWLAYMVRNKAYFFAVKSNINQYFEANVFLYIFAAAGVLIAARRKGVSLFYLAMLAGMAPMIKDYSFRFFCGEGLLPIIFLTGLGLDTGYSAAEGFLRQRTRPIIYPVRKPRHLWLG